MGVLTIAIGDEIEGELRRLVGELFGSRRGSLSACIEEALKLWIAYKRGARSDAQGVGFVALKDGKEVAKGGSLGELAERLKRIGVSPRTVEIVSSEPAKGIVRAGLRARGR